MNKDQVAFHGTVSVYDVSSSARSGIKLTLGLEHEEEYEVFREMRKSTKKVTVIYVMMWKLPHDKEWRRDEVWYLGYSVTNSAGARVRFELQDDAAFQTFMAVGCETNLELLLAELDDDERVINQTKRKRLETAIRKGGTRCRAAAILCNNEHFQRFAHVRGGDEQSPEGAAAFMRRCAGIKSRVDLDYDDEAYDRWILTVQKPFNAWPGRPRDNEH